MEKKKTTLKWRLAKLPTPEEVSDLLKSGIITKDEARDIFFKLETEETQSSESKDKEIEFLKELILRQASNGWTTSARNYTSGTAYRNFEWYTPTITYLSGRTDGTLTGGTTTKVII